MQAIAQGLAQQKGLPRAAVSVKLLLPCREPQPTGAAAPHGPAALRELSPALALRWAEHPLLSALVILLVA